ncbi:MAG: type II secretion system protein [Planctomycetes bacterium]|nr:type II secretion system protein [Planctomycetota bacterium]
MSAARAIRTASGFTLIEMLIVLGVIAALIGMAIPLASYTRDRANSSATESLVRALATAISGHQAKVLSIDEVLPGGAHRLRTLQLWDVNGDGLVDGDPQAENAVLAPSAQYPAPIISSGYRGAMRTLNPAVPRRLLDTATDRPIDAWKRPLRIGFAAGVYRSHRFGVWSAGRDGVDTTSDGDDIRSWENQ